MSLNYGNPAMYQPGVNASTTFMPQIIEPSPALMAQTVPIPTAPVSQGYYYDVPYNPIYGVRTPQTMSGMPSMVNVYVAPQQFQYSQPSPMPAIYMPPMMPPAMPMMQPMMQQSYFPSYPGMPTMPGVCMPPMMPPAMSMMPPIMPMMAPPMPMTATPVFVQVVTVPQPAPQQMAIPQETYIPQQPQMPPIPPPAIDTKVPAPQPQPAPEQAVVPQQPAQVQPAPQPVVEQATPQPVLEQPAVVQPEQVPPPAPQIDPIVVPLVQALGVITAENGKQPSLEEEANAIHVMAQYAKTYQAANDMVREQPNNPEAVDARTKAKTLIDPILIDEKPFKALANIATRDNSALTGEERQKADQNKTDSMWDLAMMQKIFRSEMDNELAKENMPRISLGELPGVSQIVDNVRKDPNPQIRSDSINALMEVTDPKNPKDVEMMKAILQTAAKEDKSKDVRKDAKQALKDIKKSSKK